MWKRPLSSLLHLMPVKMTVKIMQKHNLNSLVLITRLVLL